MSCRDFTYQRGSSDLKNHEDEVANMSLSDTKKSLSMEEWFSQATPAERDALSALQLEYQFRGDNLGNQWWIFFQALGFKHNGTAYQLPDSAPAQCKSRSYTGAEMYEQMDCFAIPQLTSPYQKFPIHPHVPCSTEQRESQLFWRSIRDQLIFRRFRSQVHGFQLKKLPPVTDPSPVPLPSVTTKGNKRKTTKDAGAELYMHKKIKSSTKHNVDKKSPVVFPTIQEYAKKAATLTINLTDIAKQEAMYNTSFDEWKFQTVMNHSLLIYGVGSKRSLLNRFAEELIHDGESVMVIDGFHKDVTIEGILDLIVTSWLGGEKISYNRYDVHAGRHLPLRSYGNMNYPIHGDTSIVQKAYNISRSLARRSSESKRAYYLILHNIDGVGLRNATAQEALAALVSQSSTTSKGLNAFRLVTSLDHINAPALLWDSVTCAQFQWIWKLVHTLHPYIEEVTHGTYTDEHGKAAPRNRKDTAVPTEHKAIFTVLSSLAPRHTEALQQLASLQANQLAATSRENTNEDSSWVPYKALFRQCQHKCVVHADEQLRRFLQELKDHGVVEQSSGDDAQVLSYRIPHGTQTLRDILHFSHTPTNNE